jgi:hypothetical protein
LSETSPKRLPLRWLTLAEIVGVVALVIAGLGYWDSHRERIQEEKERSAAVRQHDAESRAASRKPTFLMTGVVESSGERIRLASVHPDQVIQTQSVWFPKAIHAGVIETTGNPRLETGWIEEGLRKAAGKSKQGRLPVAVMTVFIEDGQTKTDTAIYQLAYSLHDRVLRPAKVQLDGLSLARQGVAGDAQAATDSLWAAR